jgi:sugar phosphate isomerase/epimerase
MRDFSSNLSALAINTATLGHNVEGHGAGWPPERVVDACAQRGIGGIVYWRREIGSRSVPLGERTRAGGLRVDGLCRTPFLVGPLALPTRQAIMDDFYASIDMAAGLGAPVLTVVVGGVVPGTRGLSESLGLVADLMAVAAPRAAASGVKLALEPLHPVYAGDRSCLVSVRDAVALCNAIAHPCVGIAIDVYHVWWDSSLKEELKRAGPERILGYHLCDWLATTRDILLDRGMMGDGVADLKSIRATVEGAGYTGPCEIEIFSAADWWTRDPDDVLDTCVARFQRVC